MSVAVAAFCLNLSVGCGFAADAPASFERDSVPLAPRSEPAQARPSGALELNPLPVMFGKFGGNLELALAPHHALVISPAYFSFTNYFHGPEAELGYRYYLHEGTLGGPFVGLGALGGAFQYHAEPGNCGPAGCSTAEPNTFVLGGTFELGWQWIVWDELVLGVGAGFAAQYGAPRTRPLYQSDFTNIAERALDSGILPRVLGSIGVVFE
jgi:hypothetical protein